MSFSPLLAVRIVVAVLLASVIVPTATTAQCEREIAQREIRMASGFGDTLLDVITPFFASMESLDLEETDTQIKLTWNADAYLTVRGEIATEPELYAPLRTALGDSAEGIAAAEAQLQRGDDVKVSFTYAPPGTEAPGSNAGGLTSLYQTALSNNATPPLAELGEYGRLHLAAVAPTITAPPKGSRRRVLRYLTSESTGYPALVVAGVLSGQLSAATVSSSTSTACRQLVSRLAPLIDALSNTTTWYLTGSYQSRSPLAGTDDWSLDFKYEWALKGEEASEAVETIFGSSLDVAGLQSAMAKLEEKGRYIHQRRRLSLTGTYKGSSSYRYGEGVQSPVSIDSTNQWKLSFSYGANLVPPSYDGTKPMLRYDLSLEYEDNLDDEEMTMRPSHRLIGRLTGSYSIPKVGEFMAEIVYSDDPEFLVQEELDNELSARLGLKVKFPSGG